MTDAITITEDRDGLAFHYRAQAYRYPPTSALAPMLAGVIITRPLFPIDETDRGQEPDGEPYHGPLGTNNPTVWAACLAWTLREAGLRDDEPTDPLDDLEATTYIDDALEEWGLALLGL